MIRLKEQAFDFMVLYHISFQNAKVAFRGRIWYTECNRIVKEMIYFVKTVTSTGLAHRPWEPPDVP